MEQQTASLDTLQVDMVRKILRKCDITVAKNMALTCRTLNTIIKNERTWQELLYTGFHCQPVPGILNRDLYIALFVSPNMDLKKILAFKEMIDAVLSKPEGDMTLLDSCGVYRAVIDSDAEFIRTELFCKWLANVLRHVSAVKSVDKVETDIARDVFCDFIINMFKIPYSTYKDNECYNRKYTAVYLLVCNNSDPVQAMIDVFSVMRNREIYFGDEIFCMLPFFSVDEQTQIVFSCGLTTQNKPMIHASLRKFIYEKLIELVLLVQIHDEQKRESAVSELGRCLAKRFKCYEGDPTRVYFDNDVPMPDLNANASILLQLTRADEFELVLLILLADTRIFEDGQLKDEENEIIKHLLSEGNKNHLHELLKSIVNINPTDTSVLERILVKDTLLNRIVRTTTSIGFDSTIQSMKCTLFGGEPKSQMLRWVEDQIEKCKEVQGSMQNSNN